MSKVFKLLNGNTIPSIAFGTGTRWFKTPTNELDQKAVDTLLLALENKHYHIDTAEIYGTHNEVAKALEIFQSNHPEVKREDLFITDKFSVGSTTGPIANVTETLKLLKTDYLDLYLVHAPFIKNFSVEQVWKEVEQLYKDGKVKNIGVSNFAVSHLEELEKYATVKPAVNQIEFSLVLQNQTPGIVKYAQEKGIVLEAYSPLAPLYKAEGPKFEPLKEAIAALAKKYGKTEAQVVLKYVNQKGIVAVTTSGNADRIKSSLKIFDFELTSAEIENLEKLGQQAPDVRQYWGPYYDKYNRK